MERRGGEKEGGGALESSASWKRTDGVPLERKTKLEHFACDRSGGLQPPACILAGREEGHGHCSLPCRDVVASSGRFAVI